MASVLTPEQLRELLATILEGAAGGTHEAWIGAIGPVQKLPTHLNLHCNWAVKPSGSKSELRAIEAAIAVVRREHPYVAL